MTDDFNLKAYMGTWYELMHYPSWFQRNDNYNTKAEYKLNCDGTVSVRNSTISLGEKIVSEGTAISIKSTVFRVDFSTEEIAKLSQNKNFTRDELDGYEMNNHEEKEPNYVIDAIWNDCKGTYLFAVVTDPRRESLYVLSRKRHPKFIRI